MFALPLLFAFFYNSDLFSFSGFCLTKLTYLLDYL